jgi:hypothetical protein
MTTLAKQGAIPVAHWEEPYTYEPMQKEFQPLNCPCELWHGKNNDGTIAFPISSEHCFRSLQPLITDLIPTKEAAFFCDN